MADAANLDGVAVHVDEKEAIIADAKPKLISALEGLHVARTGFREAMQCGENCIAIGLLRLRTSPLAGSVQAIRFTSVADSCRSLPA